MNEDEFNNWLLNGLKTMAIISIIALPFFLSGFYLGEQNANYQRCYAIVNGNKISFNNSIEFDEKYFNLTQKSNELLPLNTS